MRTRRGNDWRQGRIIGDEKGITRLLGRRPDCRGTTLADTLVVIALVAVTLAVVIPAIPSGRSCGPSRPMQNSAQIRGIHQGLVLYSQGNNGYFPGLNSNGVLATPPDPIQVTGAYTANQPGGSLVFALLLNGNYFTPSYAINPGETNPKITAIGSSGVVTPSHYSYALSRARSRVNDDGRIEEWRDNTNTQAPALSDRVLLGGAEPASPSVPLAKQRSTWTTADGDWRGSAVFGDNSTVFLTTSTIAKTRFSKRENADDNLFLTTGDSDAFHVRD